MREKKFSFVVAFWWVLGCLLLGCFLLAFAPKQARESDAENRMLAGFPEVSAESVRTGAWMSDFESFLSDGFFAREDVIGVSNRLLGLLDARTQEDRYVLDQTEKQVDQVGEDADDAMNDPSDEADPADGASRLPSSPAARLTHVFARVGGAPAVSAKATPSPTPSSGASAFIAETAPRQTAAAALDENHTYTLWLNQTDGGITQVYDYPHENMRAFAEILQMYRDALPEDGVLCFANVPFAMVANRWTRQRSIFSGWGSDVEDGLQALVGEGVYISNAPAVLALHMEAGEAIYYATDHHWSALGAYYVCADMLAWQGLPVLPYGEYAYQISRTNRDQNGDIDDIELLYPLAPTHSYIVTHLTHETELDLMAYTVRTYRAYMNNTRTPWRHIDTGFHSGRRALVIADSFGNAFAPYLLPYYDDVYMADLRSGSFSSAEAGGTVAELMAYFQVDDVYMILSTANSINAQTDMAFLREYFEK